MSKSVLVINAEVIAQLHKQFHANGLSDNEAILYEQSLTKQKRYCDELLEEFHK